MFLRASSRNHVCLRCQYRQYLRNATKPQLQAVSDISSRAPLLSRRWQSSTASARRDEDEDDEYVNSDKRFDYDRPAQPAPQRHSATRYKHWQPPPTAQLGLNVLGEPGEVLLLPPKQPRQRRQQDDSSDEPPEEAAVQKQSIHEDLVNESRPVALPEVLQSIEKIRQEALESIETVDTGDARPRVQLDDQQWRKHVTALKTGFTARQLRHYIAENRPAGFDNLKNVETMSRPRLAETIAAKLWLLKTTPQVSAASKKKINLSPAQFGLIKKTQRIREELYQQVRLGSIVIREHTNHIEVQGKERSDVVAAANWFKKMKAGIVERKIDIPAEWLEQPRQGADERLPIKAKAQSEVKRLLSRRPVVLQAKGNHWIASSFSKDQINDLERHLLLAIPIVRESRPPLRAIWPTTNPAWTSQNPTPYNNHSPNQIDGALPNGHKHLLEGENCLDALLDHFFVKSAISQSSGSQLPMIKDSGHIQFRYVAELCQTYSSDDKVPTRLEDGPVHKNLSFKSTIPYLPSFLSQQGLIPTKETLADSVTGRQLQQISFKPLDTLTWPSIEIDAYQGQDSTLTIERMYFRLPQSSRVLVALPSLYADLHISRRGELVLFNRGSSINKRFAPFAAHLADQLLDTKNVAKTAYTGNLNKVINLQFSLLEHESRVNTNGQKPEPTIKYVLQRATNVDIRTYHTPHSNPLVLELLSFTPRPESSYSRSRQVLRLSKAPLLVEEQGVATLEGIRPITHGDILSTHNGDTLAANGPNTTRPIGIDEERKKLQNFVEAAYETAAAYDSFVRERTKQAAARYPPLDD